MSGGIFISYRHDDSRHAAGRLVDRLRQALGADELFMDVDNIDLGLDFVKVLSERVAACDVMLVIIGPQWLSATDPRGGRRIDNPHDFVRIEVESALARDVRVIPILIDGAHPPHPDEVPPSLEPLTRRQATTISHEHFGADVERIVTAVRHILPADQKAIPAVQPRPVLNNEPPLKTLAAPERDVERQPGIHSDGASHTPLMRRLGKGLGIGIAVLATLSFFLFPWTGPPFIVVLALSSRLRSYFRRTRWWPVIKYSVFASVALWGTIAILLLAGVIR